MKKKDDIKRSLEKIFEGIRLLQEAFDGRRQFTIDGRLVGDIGEVVAELHYELELDQVQQHTHDANTPDGRKVQIKATFKDKLTFSKIPDFYLGIKLHENGEHEEIFNGPGKVIAEKYSHRKNIGIQQLSFNIKDLKDLQKFVEEKDRIPYKK